MFHQGSSLHAEIWEEAYSLSVLVQKGPTISCTCTSQPYFVQIKEVDIAGIKQSPIYRETCSAKNLQTLMTILTLSSVPYICIKDKTLLVSANIVQLFIIVTPFASPAYRGECPRARLHRAPQVWWQCSPSPSQGTPPGGGTSCVAPRFAVGGECP